MTNDKLNIYACRKTVLKADLIAFVARQPDIVWPRKLGNWHPPNYPTAPQIRKALANPRNGYRRAPLSNHAHQSATPDSDGSVLTPIAMSDDEEMVNISMLKTHTDGITDYSTHHSSLRDRSKENRLPWYASTLLFPNSIPQVL